MKEKKSEMSSKAKLLIQLRNYQEQPVSGTSLAKDLNISRVAVWKTVQSLAESGYSIETSDNGYLLNPQKDNDFLYPWEFPEKEHLFYHYEKTGSTMDRAREMALRNAGCGCCFIAEKQNAGRGRNGRTWVSRQGGLYFSFLQRPNLAVADYTLFSLIVQIALARSISSICGKNAFLRWPNDIYINKRKIAGVILEISGEGDLIKWLSCGIGVNVNNVVPSGKAASCSEILGHSISRKDVFIKILNEIENVKKTFCSNAFYSQGNCALAAEWNSLTDCIGAKAAVFEPGNNNEDFYFDKTSKILSRGIFQGIDPIGRCILKTEDKTLIFNQGTVSLGILN